MKSRKVLALACAAAIVLAWNAAAEAAKTKGPDAGIKEGTFVSSTFDSVVLKDADGKENTFKMADSCSVTIKGKEAKVADLKADDKITYTQNPDGKLASLRIGAPPRRGRP